MFGHAFERYVPSIIILAVFAVTVLAWRFLLCPLVNYFVKKSGSRFLTMLLQAFVRPISVFLIGIGLFNAVLSLPFEYALTASAHTGDIKRAFTVACVIWGLVAARKAIPVLLQAHSSPGIARASSYLMHLYTALVLIIGVCMILSELNYNVSGIVTSLGLGSLTLALAAKDIAGNMFSGLMIILSRPFDVGDWITVGAIEGVVEEITFRSTKVRSLADAITEVPNSIITSTEITNWTRLKRRLAKFTIGVQYNTARASVERLMKDLTQMLTEHADIHADTVEVRLHDFAENSINIWVMFYVRTSDIVAYRRIKEDVNLKIMSIMENNGVQFAFPSRSIYFETPLHMAKLEEGAR